MSQNDKSSPETTRQWLTGIAVIVAVIVSYIGFATISVGWTLAISSAILVGLVVFLGSVGRKKRAERDRG